MTSKLYRSIGIAVVAAGVALTVPAAASAQTHDKPVSLTGTWNMSLIGDHVIPVALVLEQTGTALKGTFTLMSKDFPLTGEVVGGKVTLTGKGPAFGRPSKSTPTDHQVAVAAATPKAPVQVAGPQAPGLPAALADMTISGLLDADGAMAGNILMSYGTGTGTIKWSAERFTERKVPTSQAVSTDGVSLTGRWKMTVNEAQVTLDVELKQIGSEVTGTANNEHLGAMTLKGTLANGMFNFVTTGSNAGQEMKLEYTGKYKADGTFAGDMTSPMGAMTWTAERVKK